MPYLFHLGAGRKNHTHGSGVMFWLAVPCFYPKTANLDPSLFTCRFVSPAFFKKNTSLPVSFFPLLYQHLMHSAPWSDSISATNAQVQLPLSMLPTSNASSPSVSEHKSLSSLFGSHTGTTFEKYRYVRLWSETFASPKHN